MRKNQTTEIRAILFDFGGVLAEEGFYQGLRAIAEQQGLDPEELQQQGMDAVYDSGYVTGQGSEVEFWNLLRQSSGMQGEDAALRQEILSHFILRPWMLDLVKQLRHQGYITGILSDQTDWLDQLDKRYGFYQDFDQVFHSYRLGKGKRDPSLFNDVAQLLSLRHEEILFIDDAVGNLERARSCGLHALLYRTRSILETEIASILGKRPTV